MSIRSGSADFVHDPLVTGPKPWILPIAGTFSLARGIESFNRKVRTRCLNARRPHRLPDIRGKVESW